MKRVFLAVAIPADIKEEYEQFLSTLPSFRARFEKKEKLHITLAFIGEVYDPTLETLVGIMKNIAQKQPPFVLTLQNNLGAFPTLEHANVWWLPVLDTTGSLQILYQNLTKLLAEHTIPFRQYEFLPHVTIFRKPPQEKAVQERVETMLSSSLKQTTWTVEGITLFESHLTSDNSSYKILHYENFRH